jgi:pseudaminic acid synthase
MNSVEIAGKKMDQEHPPLIVAEMSGNHNQSLDRALEIVAAAARAGADALKLQTYTADTMTLDLCCADFFIGEATSLWQGTSLYKLYSQAYTPWEWHKPIFDLCRQLGLIAFSTPFDDTAVDFLETLAVPCYKIASFEVTDLPLIEKVAATGKPMIISTGMATLAELDEAVRTARSAGCKDLVLLKCTSAYPATPEDSNLVTIPNLSDLFNCQVGLSDHTAGIGAAVAAVALGATLVEKHFTTCRADGGVDSVFSMEPSEMESLVTESRRAWQSLGRIQYGPGEQEKDSLKYRRSLYIAQDMKQGDSFTADNLRIIRPGSGLEPRYYKALLGKNIKRDAARGTPVSWDLF